MTEADVILLHESGIYVFEPQKNTAVDLETNPKNTG